MIRIKNASVLRALLLHRYNPVLVNIVSYVAGRYGVLFTEGFRAPLHPDDLHGTDPVRAIDIRSRIYPKELLEAIRDDVNSKWLYDPARPDMVCFYIHRNRSGEGYHAHIQVHPATVRKEN